MPVHGFTQHLVAIWLFTMAACLPPAALALSENGPAAADQDISATEEEEAIRWVMMEGAQSMIDTLGQENGFYKDPKYRIPMPEQYRKLEKVLRRIGGAKYADAFLLSLNKTAENSIAEGGPLITNMISEMPVENRNSLINGSNGPIGNYFHGKAATVLLGQFSPIIAKHADKAGLISSMKVMLEKARFVKALHKAKVKLDRMILEHAINLITIAIKLQENRIKSDPLARTNPVVQKVFGRAF